jgi:pSer/pThr/pTyr-binding forkhead associated (FHA) protein
MQNTAMIENLSSANKTLLNGRQIAAPVELKTGDKIKCGRVILIVDSIYEAHNFGNVNRGTEYINI